jgi:hypothetical protein
MKKKKDTDSSKGLLRVWEQTIEWKEKILESYREDDNQDMIEFHEVTLKTMKEKYEKLKKDIKA